MNWSIRATIGVLLLTALFYAQLATVMPRAEAVAPSWTVALTADSTVFSAGQSVTLTATANQDVAPVGYRIDIIDQTSNSIWAKCTSGATCSQSAIYFYTGGPHIFIAQVDYNSGMSIAAVSSPVTLSRAAWTVSLASSAQTAAAGSQVTLTATANQDVGLTGGHYAINIDDYTAGSIWGKCTSGTTCAATITVPQYSTPHMYVALVTVNGSLNDIQASSNGFSAPSSGGAVLAGEMTGGSNPSEKLCQCSHKDPVNTSTGEFFLLSTDIGLPGKGPSDAVARTYSSTNASVDSPFGYGWSPSFGVKISVLTAGNTSDPLPRQVQVTQENGSTVVFAEDANKAYQPLARAMATLVWDSVRQQWTFTRRATLSMTFDSSGKFLFEQDLHSNSVTIGYDSTGHVQSLAASGDRTMTLSWIGSHVSRIIDSAGRAVSYGYDTAGNLTTVTAVDGSTTSFGYDNNHYLNTIAKPAGGVTTNTYDAQHRVTKQTDPVGRTTSFIYSGNSTTITEADGPQIVETYSSGQLTSQVRGAGTPSATTTSYTYDAASNVASVTDGTGQTTHYTYDTHGNRTSETDPLGRATTWTFDALNNTTSVTDPLRHQTTATYDAVGDQISATSAAGQLQHWSYNADGTLATWTDANNAVTTYGYDSLGRRTSTTDPDGRVHALAYNSAGCVTAITDAAAKTTTLTCDAAGRTLTVTDADGNTTSYTYGADGQITAVQDANKRSTTASYNLDDQVTAATDANNQTTTYAYGASGAVTAKTDPNNHTTSFSYDALGRLVSITDANNHTTSYSYDLDNRLTSRRLPSGATDSTAYDAAGQITSTTDPNNQTTGYAYNADGELTSTTDPLNRVTQRTYTDDGQLATAQLPGGAIQSYGYTALGQLAQFTDADSHQTTYNYDPAGLLTSRIDPGNRATGYGYDAAGRLATITAADSSTASRHYDDAGRLTSIHYSAAGATDTTFTYDPAGQRLTMNDGTGTTTYSYDPAGHLASEQNGAHQALSYSYDPAGQLATITYPGSRTVNYSYDPAGQMTALSDWNNKTTTFGWNQDGELSSQTDPNGVTESRTYNPAGDTQTISTTNGGTTLANYTYTYDNASQLTSDTVPDPTGTTTNHSYSYDPTGQLSATTTTPAGQSATTDNYSATPAGLLTTGANGDNLTYNTAEELTTRTPTAGTATTYTYDALGNRASSSTTATPAATTTYGYAATGALANITTATDNILYTADGDGLRQTRTANGQTTNYLWSTVSALPALLDDGNHSYLYGPTSTPVAQIDDSNNTTQYLHSDNVGSIRLITDRAGQIAGATSYSTYGARTTHIGTADSAIGYTGALTDPATGLVYLRARDYDPATGQFISVDPLLDLTRQPYSYVNNQPVNAIDPTGLLGCSSFTTSWGLDLCKSASIVKTEGIGAAKAAAGLAKSITDPVGTAQSLYNACQAGLQSSEGTLQCIDNVNPLGAGGLRGELQQTWTDIQNGCTSQAGQDIGGLEFQAVLSGSGGTGAADSAGGLFSDRLAELRATPDRGSIGIPGSGGRDLRGLSTKQIEKLLNQFDTDPHSFKEEFVGKGSISKFDIKMGPGGELHIVSKDGSIVIPTGVFPS